MHIHSLIMGSTVNTPLTKPKLQGLIAWFLPQTLRILLMRIPVHVSRQTSINMMGLCFSILTVPSIFSIGDVTSHFHESGVHPPCSAAFAMSLYKSRSPSGASRIMYVVTPLSSAAFPFATFFQWPSHPCFVMGIIPPVDVVTIPVNRSEVSVTQSIVFVFKACGDPLRSFGNSVEPARLFSTFSL